MDINGGALEFEVLVDTGQLEKGLNAAKKSVQEFTASTKMGGQTMDAAYKQATERIDQCYREIDKMGDINRATLQKLQSQYDELGQRAAAAFQKGTAAGDKEYVSLKMQQDELAKYIAKVKETQGEVERVADDLQKEEQAMQKAKEKTDAAANAHVKLRTQLMNAKNALAEMEQQGKRGTAEYEAMQKELGRLQKAMRSANAQAKVMGSSFRGMEAVMSTISGVTGGFTALTGALSLFGTENENVQKSMLKVQSLMSITMGLQQVANTLHKNSAFRLTVLAGAQRIYANAVDRTSASLVAMGVSATAANVAAQALMATLTLGIGVAITAIVALVSKLVSEEKKAREEAKKMADAIAETAVKPVAAVRELSHQFSKLGNDIKAQEKFVRDNKKAFQELGIEINSVSDAENALVTNKETFIQAQMDKARALAAMQLAQEKAKELLQEQLKLESMPDTITKKIYSQQGYVAGTYEVENTRKAEQQKIVNDLEKELEGFYQTADRFNQAYKDKLKDAGIDETTTEALEGSIKAQEETIKNLQEKYSSVTTDAERRSIQTQIDLEQEKLNAMKGIYKDQNAEYQKHLQERKKLYEQYQLWATSTDPIARGAARTEFADLLKEGETYLDYLNRQRDTLLESIGSGEATRAQAEQLKTLNTEIATETNRTVLEEFDSALQAELQTAGNIIDMLDISRRHRDELTGSDADTGKSQILDDAEREAREQMEQQTADLLESYTGYLAQKLRFDAEYAENRALLERKINDETANQAERNAARAALAALEAQRELYEEDGGDEEYRNLLNAYQTFEQQKAEISSRYARQRALAEQHNNQAMLKALAEDERKEISALIADTFDAEEIEGMTDVTISSLNSLIVKLHQLNETGEITDEDMKSLINKIQQMKSELAGGNIFSRLFNAADLNQAMKAAEQLAGNFQDVALSMRDIAATTGNEDLANTMDLVSDVVGNFQAAEKGAEAWGGWWGAIIGGVLDLVPKIQKWAEKGIDDSIQEHARKVADLQVQYDELADAINRVMGTTWYNSQAQLIANLKQQSRELEAMREDEESRKNSDDSKIAEYNSRIRQNAQQMQEIIDTMKEKLLGTDVASMAKDLGDAIVNIFNQGGNAAEAWGNKVKDIVKGIVQNIMVQSLLAGQVQKIVDSYTAQWVDAEGNFKGWDTVMGSIDNLATDLTKFGEDAVPAMQEILNKFPDLFGRDSDLTTMSGAYKTASQESIDLLGGQTNAMRTAIDQGVEYLRQQLVHIAAMDNHISTIASIISQINDKIGNGEAAMRAQGMTY